MRAPGPDRSNQVHSHPRRSLRALLISAFAIAAIAASGGSALAAHQISQTGAPGSVTITDKATDPGARCSYAEGGTAGGPYLTGIRQRNVIEITLRSSAAIHGQRRKSKLNAVWSSSLRR